MALADTARLVASLELQDKFSRPIGAAQLSLGRFESSLGRMQRGVGQVGAGLATLGTRAALAAGAGLAAVITSAATMEEAFIGVQKTVDETASVSFEQLRDVIRKMSSETGTAFEELGRIGEIGGALGVGIGSLDEFIDVVNRLAVSTDLSAEDASTALGHLGTVLQLTGEDYRDLADGLVALGNAGASSEAQIVAIAERFAVAGKRAGLTTAEILALASATASMGVEVEAGGTALSNTFNEIAVAIGTGGKEITAFTDLLGINAAEFRRRWESDALGTLQEFLREVDKLPAIEQAVALEAAGITGARQQAAVGALADGYAELGRQLEVVEDREGALNEESNKFFASSSNAFRRLRENVRLGAAAIGTELLPVTNELIGEFVDFLTLASTQTALKDFGKDLAEGIRSVVKELRTADFSGFISTLQIIADVGRKVADIFLSLPPGIQAAIVTGAAINKLSGGLLGAGAGNIIGGAGGLLFDRFLARGSSPANPLWVQTVGGGVGGAGRAGAGLAGAIGTAGAAATVAGGVLALEDIATGTEEGMKKGTLALLGGFPSLIGNAIGPPIQDLINEMTGANEKVVTGVGRVERSSVNASSTASGWSARQLTAFGALTNEQRRAASATNNVVAGVHQARAAITGRIAELTGVVRAKRNNVVVKVDVTSNISISDTLRKITSARVATGTISEF